ncbi:MAG: transcriptional repressor [Alphaproteobacteria bacterium]|jgi:Fur family zinc uptake transcriptional regulator|nr:MAG: transcriptional repressor [Alphaproteobacteria bacterium]
MKKSVVTKVKLTKNQSLVLDSLIKAGQPSGAYALLDTLRPHGFKAPLQIYRALEQLIDLGLAHRLESLNAFIACSHVSCESSGATAFVICDKCETVQEICDESISNFLSSLARKTKIKASKSSIELHGLCNGCSAVSHS